MSDNLLDEIEVLSLALLIAAQTQIDPDRYGDPEGMCDSLMKGWIDAARNQLGIPE